VLANPPVSSEHRGIAYRLFRYLGPQPVGRSVVYRAGHYVTVETPDQLEVSALRDGVTYFMGGHIYTITDSVATALLADGYTVDTTQWNELTGTWDSYASDTWETIG
jgi:hypothetical protein